MCAAEPAEYISKISSHRRAVSHADGVGCLSDAEFLP